MNLLKDGAVKVVTLTKISDVDSGRVLLCQNHKDLVLLTNDHRMLNAGALLGRRLTDVLNLLGLLSETPDPVLRKEWLRLRKWFEESPGYKCLNTVRVIEDRQVGELPKHLREN